MLPLCDAKMVIGIVEPPFSIDSSLPSTWKCARVGIIRHLGTCGCCWMLPLCDAKVAIGIIEPPFRVDSSLPSTWKSINNSSSRLRMRLAGLIYESAAVWASGGAPFQVGSNAFRAKVVHARKKLCVGVCRIRTSRARNDGDDRDDDTVISRSYLFSKQICRSGA